MAAEIAKFRTDNAEILAKTVETVASSDLEAIEKALGEYEGLSDKAQAALTTEKALLDALKKKAGEAATGIDAVSDGRMRYAPTNVKNIVI